MSFTASNPDLPLDLPAPSKFEKARRYALETVRLMIDQQRKAGGVTTLSAAAKALRVSNQRISQLLERGDLERVDLRDSEGEVLGSGVSLTSVRDFLRHRKENKGGRPRKES